VPDTHQIRRGPGQTSGEKDAHLWRNLGLKSHSLVRDHGREELHDGIHGWGNTRVLQQQRVGELNGKTQDLEARSVCRARGSS
jgi:hypothetical protein